MRHQELQRRAFSTGGIVPNLARPCSPIAEFSQPNCSAGLADFEIIPAFQRNGRRLRQRVATEFGRRLASCGLEDAVGSQRSVAVVAPYLVLYWYQRDTVTVRRILHGRRRMTAAMLRWTP